MFVYGDEVFGDFSGGLNALNLRGLNLGANFVLRLDLFCLCGLNFRSNFVNLLNLNLRCVNFALNFGLKTSLVRYNLSLI